MAFPLEEEAGRIKDCWDNQEAPALSTCRNANIFRRINAILDNSLDFSRVCTTPVNRGIHDHLPDFQDSEETVTSRMLFPTSAQDSSRGLPDANDLCLGLQSLSLTGWDRPWSTQDSDSSAQSSTHSVLSMLHNPLGNVLGKPPLSFLPLDPLGSDLVDKFPAPSIRGPRLDTRPILDSRSSSPSDSDTSGFSSGSDHLSDLISSLRISPPLPFLSLTGGGPRDPLKMGVGSRMDQEQAALAAVTPSPTSASKRWPGASVWPSWDLLEAPKDPFSIEREARLHRQAAAVNEATCTWSGQLPPRNYKNPIYSCKVFLGGVPWDITEAGLVNTFRVFGSLSVEWPGKDGKHPRCPPKGNMPKGNADMVGAFSPSPVPDRTGGRWDGTCMLVMWFGCSRAQSSWHFSSPSTPLCSFRANVPPVHPDSHCSGGCLEKPVHTSLQPEPQQFLFSQSEVFEKLSCTCLSCTGCRLT